MSKDEFARYADMLELPHHVSKTRARMSLHDRAAQFSPFAALTGHEDAIAEAARLTELQAELDETRKELLNAKLQHLLLYKHLHPEVAVTWFADDARKAGGAYLHTCGKLRKYDESSNELTVEDQKIPVDRIYNIESKLLNEE